MDFIAQAFITVGIILPKKDLDPLTYPIGPEKPLTSVSDSEPDLKARQQMITRVVGLDGTGML
jgi:hypothetical protein